MDNEEALEDESLRELANKQLGERQKALEKEVEASNLARVEREASDSKYRHEVTNIQEQLYFQLAQLWVLRFNQSKTAKI